MNVVELLFCGLLTSGKSHTACLARKTEVTMCAFTHLIRCPLLLKCVLSACTLVLLVRANILEKKKRLNIQDLQELFVQDEFV